MREKSEQLPRAQFAAWTALIGYRKDHAYGPTYPELAALLHVREFAARFSISQLVIKKLVSVEPRKTRSMNFTDRAQEVLDLGIRERAPQKAAA